MPRADGCAPASRSTAATTRARVTVCGELAADPAAAALLIGLGVQELSLSPPAIPAVKDAVRAGVASVAPPIVDTHPWADKLSGYFGY